jgi:hypothetical protein
MRRAPQHHSVVLPQHQHPRRRLGGWLELVLPLAPPEGWGIIVGNVHHGRTVARGGGKCW